MRAGRIAKTVVVMAAIGVAVAACGRKGPLDSPYEAALDERRQIEREGERPVPPEPQPPAADRPFILDGLI